MYRGKLLTSLVLLSVLPVGSFAANNFPITSPFPDTVYVRKSCGSMANCGNTLAELKTWIDSYKKPSNSAPLLIDIGPGNFAGYISCANYSRMSVRGAGPTQTVLTGASSVSMAISGNNCFDLVVQDLSIKTSLLSGIGWTGGGSSTWTNVHVENEGVAFPSLGRLRLP